MCNCEDKSGFKRALREAYAATTTEKQMAVWENPDNKLIYQGERKNAEARLKAGKIECYFIPRKSGDEISFRIVNKAEPTERPKVAKPEK